LNDGKVVDANKTSKIQAGSVSTKESTTAAEGEEEEKKVVKVPG